MIVTMSLAKLTFIIIFFYAIGGLTWYNICDIKHNPGTEENEVSEDVIN